MQKSLACILAAWLAASPAFAASRLQRRLEGIGLTAEQAIAIETLSRKSRVAEDKAFAQVRVFYKPSKKRPGKNLIIVLLGETHMMPEEWKSVAMPVMDSFKYVGIEGYLGDEHTKEKFEQGFGVLKHLIATSIKEEFGEDLKEGPIGSAMERLGLSGMSELLEGKYRKEGDQSFFWLEHGHHSNELERKTIDQVHEVTSMMREGSSILFFGTLGLAASWWYESTWGYVCSIGACVLGALFYGAGVHHVKESPEAKAIDLNGLVSGRNKTVARNVRKTHNKAKYEPVLAVMGSGHMSCAESLAHGSKFPSVADLLADKNYKELPVPQPKLSPKE